MPAGAPDPALAQGVAPLLDALETDWATWTGRDLGTVYEALLDGATRREAGIFYTPAPVVDSIIAMTVGPLIAAAREAPDPTAALAALRVLDPACGAGYFLTAAVDALAAALAEVDPARGPAAAWRARAAGCVYGADSDPVALDLTRYSLALQGGAACADAARLTEGDALADLPDGWAGFDAVVGNPPYVGRRAVAPAQKARYAGRYRAARGQYDLSTLFMERGLGLLRPDGRLGYIVPNKFMAAEYGAPLRALLAREATLLRLDDVSSDGVFAGAAAYPVILVLRRAAPPPGGSLALGGGPTPGAMALQAEYCGLSGGVWPAGATPALLALAGRMARAPGRAPARAIRCGIARGGVARSAIGEAAYKRLPPSEQAEYAPFLQAQDVGAYAVDRARPARYLRRDAAPAGQNAAFAAPKVIVPGVTRRLRAAYTAGGEALGRVYFMAEGATGYDPFYLLALLNSRALAWYYGFLYWPVHLSGGYLRVNAPYLARLPLPAPDARGGARLAATARLLAAGLLAPMERERLQAEIDGIVCGLYDVDAAEIAMAERGLPASVRPGDDGARSGARD
jgi:hypothetical protein